MYSSPRAAFRRSASRERCRKIDNSSSLKVPFNPSNNLSLAPVAGQPRRLDCQHRARRAGAHRREQTLKAGTDLTTARTAEIFVNDNDLLPAELVCPCDQRILSPAALGIVEQLIRRRLPNIDISFARQVLRRNLIHCWPR